MNDTIVCPNCKKAIPLTQALSHQLKEKYDKFYKIRLEEERLKIQKEEEKKSREKLDLQYKDKVNEVEELRKQNKFFQEQLLELNKTLRQLKFENQQKQLEMEKRLAGEQEKIRLEEKKRFEEEYKFKILEKDKKLSDAMKMVEDYKRKLEQGSQQLQGEVLELELEATLKREFPFDEIKPVSKGIKGADVIQIVNNNQGRACGTIIWELKRTRNWTDSWLNKLKEDQRRVKAEVSVIISQILPEGIKNFGKINDVWIGNYESITGLAVALRKNLIDISSVKLSMVGRQEKKEILWNYLTGIEFKQRVEAIYDAYNQLQIDLEIEKRWFTKKWAKQEKDIRLVIDNILGMHGDLQSIVGKALAEVKGLDMLTSGKEKETLF